MCTFIDDMMITSNFSLLAYVPVPSKLSYWQKHSKRYLQEIIWDPPVLRNFPSFTTVEKWHRLRFSWMRRNLMKKLPAVLAFPIWLFLLMTWFIAVFTVQIIKPLVGVLCPIVAIFGFMVKMQSLPDVSLFGEWTQWEWMSFFGILNQAGKTWDICSVERVLTMTLLNCELSARPGELVDEVFDAAVEELGVYRTAVLSMSVDGTVLGDIMNFFLKVTPHGNPQDPRFERLVSKYRFDEHGHWKERMSDDQEPRQPITVVG